jgi:subtilase family serine protease
MPRVTSVGGTAAIQTNPCLARAATAGKSVTMSEWTLETHGLRSTANRAGFGVSPAYARAWTQRNGVKLGVAAEGLEEIRQIGSARFSSHHFFLNHHAPLTELVALRMAEK